MARKTSLGNTLANTQPDVPDRADVDDEVLASYEICGRARRARVYGVEPYSPVKMTQ